MLTNNNSVSMPSHSSRHACKILLYEYNFEITKNNQESVLHEVN